METLQSGLEYTFTFFLDVAWSFWLVPCDMTICWS